MKEIWKDIPEFNGLYQASTKGRVRSVDVMKDGTSKYGKRYKYFHKGKVLSSWEGVGKYKTVILYRDGFPEIWFVHRLMAITFLENTHYHKVVSFKDGDKTNVCLENLQWGRCRTKGE